MPMKNPPHPGELVRNNLTDLDLSVAEGAKGLGVTRQQLYNVINGKSGITPEMAVRLEKAFGIRMDTLMRMQSTYDIAETRSREKQIEVKPFVPKANNVPQAGAP